MLELSDARIRLEGALDELERATAAIDDARRMMRKDELGGLVSAVLLGEAASAHRNKVALLLPTEPALRASVARYDRSRAALQRQLDRRAAQLRLSTTRPLEIAAQLATERVLWEGRTYNTPGLLLIGLLSVGYSAVLCSQWLLGSDDSVELLRTLALPLIGGAAFLAHALTRPRLVVTQRRVIMGEVVLEPTATRRLLQERVEHEEEEKVTFTIRYEDAADGDERVSLSAMPSRLERALRSMDFPLRP